MQRYGPPPAYPSLRLLGARPVLGDSFSLVSKAVLEECARKAGRPGLYATFRGLADRGQPDLFLWGAFQHHQEPIPEPEPPLPEFE
jgi:hypothetical protein